jgi:hypothetical protein
MTTSNVFEESVFIDRKNNSVKLKMKKKYHYFVPMLAQIDFAVIPRGALDEKLRIHTFAITSGPFYLKDKQSLILIKNPNFIIKDNYPDEIYLTKVEDLQNINMDSFDLIPAFFPLQNELKFSENYDVHKTIPVKVWKLVFTPNGLKKFNREQRYYIANLIRNKSAYYFKDKMISNQTFQSDSVFALSSEEIDSILNHRIKYQLKTNDKVKIGVHKSRLNFYYDKFSDNDFIVSGFKSLDESNSFDLILMNQDIGYEESASFISYSLQSKFFGIENSKANKYLKRYLSLDDKNERVLLIKEMNRHIMNNATVIYLYFEEYVSRYRKTLKVVNSKNNAAIQFWKVFPAND